MAEKMAATPMMAQYGFSFDDALNYAQEGIRLLEEIGPTVIDSLRTGFRLWQAFTARDFAQIITLCNAEVKDVQAIIAAIKAAFDIP